uniref:Uncharacterized protein n=2 Tax=Anguilla anguilla TaxID=7936 RepID=A0A0E9RN73_ANGAN
MLSGGMYVYGMCLQLPSGQSSECRHSFYVLRAFRGLVSFSQAFK